MAKYKLLAKDAAGKNIIKLVDDWDLDNYRKASGIEGEVVPLELSVPMFEAKIPVIAQVGNTLVKITLRQRKGPVKGAAASKVESAEDKMLGKAIEVVAEADSVNDAVDLLQIEALKKEVVKKSK